MEKREGVGKKRGRVFEERNIGAVSEMSWVLCNIFGLSCKQVQTMELDVMFGENENNPGIDEVRRKND